MSEYQINLRGVRFPADLIVLETRGIDVIFWNELVAKFQRNNNMCLEEGDFDHAVRGTPGSFDEHTQSGEFKSTGEAAAEG